MDSKAPLLSLESLKVELKLQEGVLCPVDGINLDVTKGEIFGLVGESGSGKSMMALSIMRLLPEVAKITKGKILLHQNNSINDITKLSPKEMLEIRGKEISMIFQDPMTYLNPVLRVGSQIAESLTAHKKLSKKEVARSVTAILAKTQLPNPSRVANYFPHELSGGMRQRVLIAMAIACGPSLLIADEPTTALDVTVQSQILDLLRVLKEKDGMSIILITHDLGIVAGICDKVCIMYAGEIVESAHVGTLFKKPLHPYAQGLLESVRSLDGTKDELYSITGDVPNLINPLSGCRFHPRCSYAFDKCQKAIPPRIAVEADHEVSCWLYMR